MLLCSGRLLRQRLSCLLDAPSVSNAGVVPVGAENDHGILPSVRDPKASAASVKARAQAEAGGTCRCCEYLGRDEPQDAGTVLVLRTQRTDTHGTIVIANRQAPWLALRAGWT